MLPELKTESAEPSMFISSPHRPDSLPKFSLLNKLFSLNALFFSSVPRTGLVLLDTTAVPRPPLGNPYAIPGAASP